MRRMVFVRDIKFALLLYSSIQNIMLGDSSIMYFLPLDNREGSIGFEQVNGYTYTNPSTAPADATPEFDPSGAGLVFT